MGIQHTQIILLSDILYLVANNSCKTERKENAFSLEGNSKTDKSNNYETDINNNKNETDNDGQIPISTMKLTIITVMRLIILA